MPDAPTPTTDRAPAAADPSSAPPDRKPEEQGLWRGMIRPLLIVILVVTALRSSLVDWNDVPTGSMNPTILEGDRIVVNKLAYGFNLPFNGPAYSIPFVARPIWNPLDFLPGFYYGTPQRNDIVTFWKPGTIDEGGAIRMVKRVVAVPGDEVALRPATISVNGQPHDISALIINGEVAQYTAVGSGRNLRLVETIAGASRQVQYLRNQPEHLAEIRRRGGSGIDRRAAAFGPVKLEADQYLVVGDNRDNSFDGRFFGPVDLKQITGKAKFIAVAFDGGYLNPAWDRWFKGLD